MQCPYKVPLKGKFDILGNQVYRPCGGCSICRRNKVMQVSARAQYEYNKSTYCSFVTLTYDDNHLYYPHKCGQMNVGLPSLHKEDFTKVIDSLRHYLNYHKVNGATPDFGFVLSGEYGGRFGRPHGHILFFGVDFPIAKKILTKLWKFGFVDSRPLLSGAIRYVIKYLGKQETGHLADLSYNDKGIERPFVTFSKGLGSSLFSEHIEDINKYGAIKYGNHYISVPPYYRDKYINLNYDNLVDRAQTSEYNRVYSNATKARYLGFKSISEMEKKLALNYIANDNAKRRSHREIIDLYDR